MDGTRTTGGGTWTRPWTLVGATGGLVSSRRTGKLTRSQAQALARSQNVVMWDVLAGDFVEHGHQDVPRRLQG